VRGGYGLYIDQVFLNPPLNVVLAQRELPWERNVFKDQDSTTQRPWLALLLFAEDEQIELAKHDLDTATALLTARHIAGDTKLSGQVIAHGLASWNKRSKQWLPLLPQRARARQALDGQQADAHRVDEAVVRVGGVEDRVAADGRDAERVPVAANSGHHARDDWRRHAGAAHAQIRQIRRGPRAGQQRRRGRGRRRRAARS